MGRMSIYVPDDIRNQMRSMEGINWSKIAQQAFAKKIKSERGKWYGLGWYGLEKKNG